MIDSTSEHLLSLREAADSLPGGAIHVTTIHRWCKRGIRGVRLETILRGGIRYTSSEAIDRFFTATTEAAAGKAVTGPVRTLRQRERDKATAHRKLAEAGI